jgi:hypothetical protein
VAGTDGLGGGGGATCDGSPNVSGKGGDGVVIIAYPTSQPLASATSGSPTYSSARAGYHVYTFTASGSILF